MAQAVNNYPRFVSIPSPTASVPEDSNDSPSNLDRSSVNGALSPTATTVASPNPAGPPTPTFQERECVSPDGNEVVPLKKLTLLEAAATGRLDVVTELLNAKGDPNQRDARDDNTALHLAASYAGGQEIVAMLIDRGARTSKLNKDGYAPCHIAQQKGCDAIGLILQQSLVCKFALIETSYSPPNIGLVRKIKSPLDGRVQVIVYDKDERVIRIYKHIKADILGKGTWKVCRPVFQDSLPDAVRLVMKPPLKDGGKMMKNFHQLLRFHRVMGDARGIAKLDLALLSKNPLTGEESIDLYQKRYKWDLINLAKYKLNDPLSNAQKIQLIRDSLFGLYAMHEKGVAHCDIKPDNILVDSTLRAALSDFDLCVFPEDIDLPASGSLGYLSPELGACFVSEGKPSVADRQSGDIWAMGIVIYCIAMDWQRPISPSVYGLGPDDLAYLNVLQGIHASHHDCLFPEPQKDSALHLIWQMLKIKKEDRITMGKALEEFNRLFPEQAAPIPSSSAAAAAAGP